MKLQFIPDTAGGMIRLFDFNPGESHELLQVFARLAEGEEDSVAIHALPFISVLNDLELTALVDDRQRNPDTEYSVLGGATTTSFIWRGTREEWRAHCETLEPFTKHCDVNSYAWLTDDLGVQVLLSSSGSW